VVEHSLTCQSRKDNRIFYCEHLTGQKAETSDEIGTPESGQRMKARTFPPSQFFIFECFREYLRNIFFVSPHFVKLVSRVTNITAYSLVCFFHVPLMV